MSKKSITNFGERKTIATIKVEIKMFKPKYFNFEFIANGKIYIKDYKYNTCKAPKNHSSINCSKAKKSNA